MIELRQILRICAVLYFSMVFSAHAVWEKPELGHHMTKVSKPVVAPHFILNDLDEAKVDFSNYRGKVVLLNFWATWCPPCRREMPSMERLYQRFDKNKFAILAVNQIEDEETVFSFAGQLSVDPTFPILFDKKSSVSKKYRVNGLPTTYLIDKFGKIRYRAIGGREFDHPEIEKIILNLINE